MGLKKNNYTNKETGLTLPNAYALIKNLRIDSIYGVAMFVVQTSRDNCFDKEPIFTKELMFTVNREENPYTTAYNKAKEQVKGKYIEPETGEEKEWTKEQPFFGWEDDYGSI